MNIVALFQSYWPKHLKRAHIHTAPNCAVLSSHVDDSSAAAALLEFFIMFRTPSYLSQSAAGTITVHITVWSLQHIIIGHMLPTSHLSREHAHDWISWQIGPPGDHLPTKTLWVCSACLVAQDLDKTGWVMTAKTAAVFL